MVKKRKLGRGVSVVGAGMSKFGMFPDKDSKDLFAEAFNEMLASVDKGVDPNDIDALYLGNFSNDFFTHQAHWGPHAVKVHALGCQKARAGRFTDPLSLAPFYLRGPQVTLRKKP